MHSVAHKFGIPPTILHEKVGAGGPTVLSISEEQEIAVACMTLADMGFGLTREVVGGIVSDYLLENSIPNPFTNGVPGKDWWQRFLKQWPCITERKPQHLVTKRAAAGVPDIINAWLDKLEDVFKSASLDASNPAIVKRLWNCDETAFSTSASASKAFARRNAKAVHKVGGGSGHECITVHCAGSASGERLPPFILYKGKTCTKVDGGCSMVLYGVSVSGWMDASNFLSWFKKLFLRAAAHLIKTTPVLLFIDGHHSHISLYLIRTARDSKVILLCLPPNTAHLLQPLDIGVFGPLKTVWRSILKRYKLETRGKMVSTEIFPSLVA